jgi:hypothetical protein
MLADKAGVGHEDSPEIAVKKHQRLARAMDASRIRNAGVLAGLMLLAACATQTGAAVSAKAPGFLFGVWHGFIFPVAWVISLFIPDVSVYAVPNNGGWYDFGYFIGIVFLGVGARSSRRRPRR